MRLSLMAITTIVLPSFAFAAAEKVKIDSFAFTGSSTSTAELCGHTEDAAGSRQILILSDPKSKGPGKYVANTTPQGEFCAVIATVTGTAEVSIIGSTFRVQTDLSKQQ